MNRYRSSLRATLLAIPMIAAAAPLLEAQPRGAQPPGADAPPMTAQLVDSRKGYVARIPTEFRLDSAASGWSPTRHYEIRTYRYPGVGMIRLIVTVKAIVIPRDTVNNGSYTYAEADSATERGTAKMRTYFLPTRSVRIELVPQSIRMSRYLESAQEIFDSFRWKPGATTEAIETDPPIPAGK